MESVSEKLDRAALRLYPYREWLLAAGLASFVAGSLPLMGVARGSSALAGWHVVVFASSIPLVLWPICLAVLAQLFHPTEGLLASLGRSGAPAPSWVGGLLRGYALLTLSAFAIAPVFVLAVAAI